jgi:hypothetical protein
MVIAASRAPTMSTVRGSYRNAVNHSDGSRVFQWTAELGLQSFGIAHPVSDSKDRLQRFGQDQPRPG